MTSLAKPTSDLVDRAVARLGKTGATGYFFDRLNNPDWIDPLYQRGFFKRPPPAVRNGEEGTIGFPDWPELRYLLRMAEGQPEVVGRVVLAIPDTDNVRVHELLAEIGAQLPKEYSGPLATRALDWLDNPFTRTHSGEHFARLVAHLVKQGERKRGRALAERLLSPLERPGAMDTWYLERNLKICLPAVQEALGLDALMLLQQLLVKQMTRDGREEGDDYSYIWRRDLEKENFAGKEPRDVFIDAILETSRHLARTDGIGFDVVCGTLLAARRPIFLRIAMYLAAEIASETHPFVIETLSNPEIIDRSAYGAEYARLLQAMFPRLHGEFRDKLVHVLTSNFLGSMPEQNRSSLNEQEASAIAANVELRRLLAFGNAIPTDLIARRDELLGALGEPTRATAVWHGPTSALSDEQLQGMSPIEIVDFLRTWKPTGTFGAPTPEGLGRALQNATRGRALELSRSAEVFIGSEPTYVRAVVTGLAEAVAAKQSIEWERVLVLLSWVCSQPREDARRQREFSDDADPGWSWTRLAIARLMENGLVHPESGLTTHNRDAVWAVIECLLQDPDPLDSGESRLPDSDHLTRSINSVRGLALQTAVRYIWWIHSAAAESERTSDLVDRNPEICRALERALEDPSPAVRCVLGEFFPSLFYLDRAWTTRHIDVIFPAAEQAQGFWRATWGTFVDYAQPYDAAFDALRSKYDLAVQRLGNANDPERKDMGERGLGQHLASYFWREVDGERSTERLLAYFDVCRPEFVGHTLWVLGRGLAEAKDAPRRTLARLMELWSQLRSRSASWPEQKQRELVRHFGTWFASEQLDCGATIRVRARDNQGEKRCRGATIMPSLVVVCKGEGRGLTRESRFRDLKSVNEVFESQRKVRLH